MKKSFRIVLGVAVAGFGLLTAVMASTEVKKAMPVPSQPALSAGIKVTIDPETNTFGGVPDAGTLSAAELNALSTESSDLIEVHHPDGSVSMDLDGRFQSSAMLTIDAQGHQHFSCVTSPSAAQAVLGQPVSTVPALEEK